MIVQNSADILNGRIYWTGHNAYLGKGIETMNTKYQNDNQQLIAPRRNEVG
jgi:hypothetical protein